MTRVTVRVVDLDNGEASCPQRMCETSAVGTGRLDASLANRSKSAQPYDQVWSVRCPMHILTFFNSRYLCVLLSPKPFFAMN
jgi:hypothetical protein